MPRSRTQSVEPRIDDVVPAAALPGGAVELLGANLGPGDTGAPVVTLDGQAAHILMSRPSRLGFRVPDLASTGMIEVSSGGASSNAAPIRIARELGDGLHPVTSPAVSRSGMIYATISGPRGDLFVTSRAEGAVYRVDPAGEFTVYAEGMGVATGAAFDRDGNLFVGDRSGTIFKINPERKIYVHATLEPSVSAYHLAMSAGGTLFVTAPTLSPHEPIWAIEPNGDTHAWFRGLGRPQGLAVGSDGNVYVAATVQGRRGIVRVTEKGEASLALAGNNIVGIAFSPLGTAIVATTGITAKGTYAGSIYDVDLSVEGQSPF
jgi:sugar lactone lactonase YvrE